MRARFSSLLLAMTPCIAAGQTIPNSPLLGGLSGAFVAVSPGTGLSYDSGAASLSVNYGTGVGTAAQGNDSRIVGALQSTGGSLTGTISGGTLSGVTLSGSIGGTPTFTGNTNFSGRPVFTGGGVIVGQTTQTSPSSILLRQNASVSSIIYWQTPTSDVWHLGTDSVTQTGNDTGASFIITAYNDDGSSNGQAVKITRASGPLGLGPPSIQQLAPYYEQYADSAAPGGIIGNQIAYGMSADLQPTSTLGTNPVATVAGSTTVTVNWIGCCTSGEGTPLDNSVDQTAVNFITPVTVGGITLSGWYPVQSLVDANDFTITAAAAAISSSTGGTGATVQPMAVTGTDVMIDGDVAGTDGFVTQTRREWALTPAFYQPSGGGLGPHGEMYFSWGAGPPDQTGTNYWNFTGWEFDLTNRGYDAGYQPIPRSAKNLTQGILLVANNLPSWAPNPTGDTATNMDIALDIGGRAGTSGWYDGLDVQPRALVGASEDPSGHGGVGVDVFGAYVPLSPNPFTTAASGNVITVYVNEFQDDTEGVPSSLFVNGDSVYFPAALLLNGVNCPIGDYTISNVNNAARTFQITACSGSSSGIISGGGANRFIYPDKLSPYAPLQAWGEFAHGIITTNYRSIDGALISTQPGSGFIWNDGTASAGLNSTEISGGNISVSITPAGTGVFSVLGSLSLPSLATGTAAKYLCLTAGNVVVASATAC